MTAMNVEKVDIYEMELKNDKTIVFNDSFMKKIKQRYLKFGYVRKEDKFIISNSSLYDENSFIISDVIDNSGLIDDPNLNNWFYSNGVNDKISFFFNSKRKRFESIGKSDFFNESCKLIVHMKIDWYEKPKTSDCYLNVPFEIVDLTSFDRMKRTVNDGLINVGEGLMKQLKYQKYVNIGYDKHSGKFLIKHIDQFDDKICILGIKTNSHMEYRIRNKRLKTWLRTFNETNFIEFTYTGEKNILQSTKNYIPNISYKERHKKERIDWFCYTKVKSNTNRSNLHITITPNVILIPTNTNLAMGTPRFLDFGYIEKGHILVIKARDTCGISTAVVTANLFSSRQAARIKYSKLIKWLYEKGFEGVIKVANDPTDNNLFISNNFDPNADTVEWFEDFSCDISLYMVVRLTDSHNGYLVFNANFIKRLQKSDYLKVGYNKVSKQIIIAKWNDGDSIKMQKPTNNLTVVFPSSNLKNTGFIEWIKKRAELGKINFYFNPHLYQFESINDDLDVSNDNMLKSNDDTEWHSL